MEAGCAVSLKSPSPGWMGRGRAKPVLTSFPLVLQATAEVPQWFRADSPRVSWRDASGPLRLRCSYKKIGAVNSEGSRDSFINESFILKKKAQAIIPHLDGRSIYLVGMMGSGKSTIGKILAEALEYSFEDSDKLVEKDLGGISVAQIFKEYSEQFFRDNESRILHNLSSVNRLVVATGGGAVIDPKNWMYMKRGITVWLDVPLESLARRIASVGTASRPLLDHESGDAYTKAYMRLSALAEERLDSYANADARVSFASITGKQGKDDANDLTPTATAIEVLVRIEDFLVPSNRVEETILKK